MRSTKISTLNETSLHAALKRWYARAGDRVEVPVDGFIVDLVRGDLLVEIQTGNFSSIRRKLNTLLEDHAVRLVYPVEQEKWIIKAPKAGRGKKTRRKSPKRGALEHVFQELVGIPQLLIHPRFSIEVLLIRSEEVRRFDGRRRKGWVTHERRLIEVVDQRLFQTPKDLSALLPSDLPENFSTADLAHALGKPRWLAQKMCYCLRHMDEIRQVGKRGNAALYAKAS